MFHLALKDLTTIILGLCYYIKRIFNLLLVFLQVVCSHSALSIYAMRSSYLTVVVFIYAKLARA